MHYTNIPYFRNDSCWLADPYIWGFMGVVAAVLCFNSVVILVVLRTQFFKKSRNEIVARQDKPPKVLRKIFRVTVVMVYTLGITWMIGFFNDLSVAAQYVFVILNLSSGIILLLLEIVTNRALKEAISNATEQLIPTREIIITSTKQ